MQKKWVTILLLLLALGFIVGATLQLADLNNKRKEFGLEQVDPFVDEQVSSEFRLPTAALFTFRALALDYLWIRAENLKDQGQFFDANHLARMICTLQPHLAQVWDFQAWNMAYNISVQMPTPAERWLWVNHGVKLLRDEGIPKNPRKIKLYHSLANIFFHKMGGITDDDHRFYKWQLAFELGPLLNPIYSDSQGGGDKKDIQAMAQLPTNLAELAQDEKIALLLQQIRAVAVFENDDDMIWSLIDNSRIKDDKSRSDIRSIIHNQRFEQAMIDLDSFARAYGLRQRWKLEPQLMAAINEQYGPRDLLDETIGYSLDWRLPWTHGLYWAVQGLTIATDMNTQDAQNLHRMIYHSLQDLYRYGKMTIYIQDNPDLLMADRHEGQEILAHQMVEYLPVFNSYDLRMLDIAYRESGDIVKSLEAAGYRVPGGIDSYRANLIRNGVQMLYLQGHEAQARKKYEAFRRDNPENEMFQLPLEQFVVQAMREEIASITPQYAMMYVLGNLTNAYKSLIFGEEDNAARLNYLAEEVFKRYQQEFPEAEDFTQRTTLPYMYELKAMAAAEVFFDPQVLLYPEFGDMLMARIQVEPGGDWLYNRLKPIWDEQKQRILAAHARMKAQEQP